MAAFSDIEHIVRQYYGTIERPETDQVDALDVAEARLSLKIPEVLRFFYSHFGWSTQLGQAHEHLFPPVEFMVRDGTLIFARENQGVYFWGFPISDLSLSDPPVHRAINPSSRNTRLEWVHDHDKLSEFLITFAYWQAVNGALGNVGVAIDVPSSAIEAIERNWPELSMGLNSTGVRFFGRGGQIICVAPDAPQVSAGGRTPDDLWDITRKSGIQWDYSEPEVCYCGE